MIKYLTRNQIDITKYDNCVLKSINCRVYGYSWYLDTVCDDWDVLILGDYIAVMPLPKRKKYGINYIYQAPWIQQLGVFSKDKIKQKLIVEFIQHIPKKFKLIDLLLNSGNTFLNSNIKVRINYILSLENNFVSIKNKYNKNRKRISKTDFSIFIIDKKGNSEDFLELYKQQELKFKTHKDGFEKLEKLVGLKNKHTNIWLVYYDKTIIAGLFWLKDEYRITYLAPISTTFAKQQNIPTFLINELIKEHVNTKVILDFEGSMVKGVANFYKSFGVKKETYYQYKKYRL